MPQTNKNRDGHLTAAPHCQIVVSAVQTECKSAGAGAGAGAGASADAGAGAGADTGWTATKRAAACT